LVVPDGDQALAAEPGFDGHSPQGGDPAVIFFQHASDHPPEVLEQQSENDLALAQGPAQALGIVVEDGASGAAMETAPRPVIEFMEGRFDSGNSTRLHGRGRSPPSIQMFSRIGSGRAN
jgi:hypothetical protein